MKIKRLFSIVALGLFGVVSAAAGLSMRKEAEPAKADAPKTWMFRAQLNLADCSPSYEECVFPEDKPVDGVKFHYWGADFDITEDASLMSTFTFDYYAVNVAMEEDQVITGAQWILHQKDVGDLYSVNIDKFGDVSNSTIDKNTSYVAIQWQFGNSWDYDHWRFISDNNWGYPCSSFQLHEEDEVAVDFVKEPENGVFAVRNFEYSNTNWIEWISGGNVELEGAFYGMVDDSSRQYVTGGGRQWMYLSDSGTYDFVVKNGSVSILKHEEKVETYIYYVTNSNAATTDYIYSWGGSEQFGSFPGTSIADLVKDDKATEVTGNGVLHFQGSETPKLIYKINIDMGYPVGDSMFMFNNGTSEYKSDERAISAEKVYWWTGPANSYAKWGLEFLLTVEAYRNSAGDYSVCNIDADSAAFLVGQYNSLPEDSRVTYVDTTTVYTWTDSTKTAEGLISYKQVMIQLGKIGGVAPVGSSLPDIPAFYNDTASNNAAIAIIIVTSCLAITAVGVLLIVKKKRHN